MNRIMLFVFFLSASTSRAAVTMSRVVAVNDSHTITVKAGGQTSTVTLKGITVPAADEAAATDLLRLLLTGAWVYVEDGDVYRSPDGLFVNGELQRRTWRVVPGMRYLGEANPAPRSPTAVAPRPQRQRRTAAPRPPRRTRRPRLSNRRAQ